MPTSKRDPDPGMPRSRAPSGPGIPATRVYSEYVLGTRLRPSCAQGQKQKQNIGFPPDPGRNRPNTPDLLRNMTDRTLPRTLKGRNKIKRVLKYSWAGTQIFTQEHVTRFSNRRADNVSAAVTEAKQALARQRTQQKHVTRTQTLKPVEN